MSSVADAAALIFLSFCLLCCNSIARAEELACVRIHRRMRRERHGTKWPRLNRRRESCLVRDACQIIYFMGQTEGGQPKRKPSAPDLLSGYELCSRGQSRSSASRWEGSGLVVAQSPKQRMSSAGGGMNGWVVGRGAAVVGVAAWSKVASLLKGGSGLKAAAAAAAAATAAVAASDKDKKTPSQVRR